MSLRRFALILVLTYFNGSTSSHADQIEGVVLDPQGKPSRNAIVVAANQESGFILYEAPDDIYYGSEQLFYSPWDNNQRKDGAGKAKTDRQGRFTLKGLKQGKFVLLAVHPNHGVAQIKDVEPSKSAKPITIRLEPPTYIEGQIHGYLPKKSTSWLLRGREEYIETDHGDANLVQRPPESVYGPVIQDGLISYIDRGGRFRIGPLLVGGRYTLRVKWSISHRLQDTDLVLFCLDVAAGKTTHADIHMDGGVVVKGRIIDQSGKPLNETSVRLVRGRADNELGAFGFGAETDGKGRFEVRGVLPGEYVLTCDRTWQRSKEAQMGTVCEPATTEFITAGKKLTIGDDSPPEMIITVTEADRKRASDFEAAQAAAAQKAMEAATQRATTQAAR